MKLIDYVKKQNLIIASKIRPSIPTLQVKIKNPLVYNFYANFKLVSCYYDLESKKFNLQFCDTFHYGTGWDVSFSREINPVNFRDVLREIINFLK